MANVPITFYVTIVPGSTTSTGTRTKPKFLLAGALPPAGSQPVGAVMLKMTLNVDDSIFEPIEINVDLKGRTMPEMVAELKGWIEAS